MRSPLIQILDTIVKLDARDTRKIIDMANAHLRDLLNACLRCGGDWGDVEHTGGLCQNPVRESAEPQVTTMSEQQKRIADEVVADYRDELLARRELEAAVLRERERLDGPDDDGLPHNAQT